MQPRLPPGELGRIPVEIRMFTPWGVVVRQRSSFQTPSLTHL